VSSEGTERFETIIITPEIIKDAIDCSLIKKLSFWDALIVAAAESVEIAPHLSIKIFDILVWPGQTIVYK